MVLTLNVFEDYNAALVRNFRSASLQSQSEPVLHPCSPSFKIDNSILEVNEFTESGVGDHDSLHLHSGDHQPLSIPNIVDSNI